ncbi:sensor domain-containing diguanylate cyclase [Cellulosilyticum sp. I15G10I2]|uniref:sensor domain-containing diguanylate cyclase n=1 Tax=Cellulosilyticum sp. I15G10I2 TaxID=1892843 RepID=UPI00085BDC1C|nr:diguanylate cyclase [Cellulosilyticum sp. I15G10I2]
MKKIINKIWNLFKSLRITLILPVVLQLIVVLVLIGFLQIAGANKATSKILLQLQQQVTTMIHDTLYYRLSEAHQLNQIHAHSWYTDVLNKADIESDQKYFVNHLKAFPHAAMTFIGFSDGSFYGARRLENDKYQIVRNNEETKGASWYYNITETAEPLDIDQKFPDFDPRKRPWYIKAHEAGQPVFSKIYSHFIFQEPTITASYPIYHQDQLVGVFGVDYLLSWLNDTLRSLPIGKSGQVFITDEEGYLIASSTEEKTKKSVGQKFELVKAIESDNALTSFAIEQVIHQGNHQLSKIKFNNESYFINVYSFDKFNLNWQVYILLSAKDYMSEMNDALRRSILLAGTSSIILWVLAMKIARWIIKPIIRLNHAAKNIVRGKLIILEEEDRQDELGELTHSFNEMTQQLTQMVIHLEDQVQERTKELEEEKNDLYQIAFFDRVTGMANRKYFDNAFQIAWKSAVIKQLPIALIIIDVDFFKKYNDTYGHQVGEDCLEAIGMLLKRLTNKEDSLAASIGGGEFRVILERPLIKEIDVLAENILRSIEDMNRVHSTSPYGRVTVSIGTAVIIPQSEEKSEDFILLADQALYIAKNKGRNRMERIII